MFDQLSLSPTVLLKTNDLGVLRASTQKYPTRWNWYDWPTFAFEILGSTNADASNKELGLIKSKKL